MLAGLTQWRWRVQHFRTRACPTATEAVGQVTGLPGRHLDAWLMPAPVCRSLFARAAASAELSLVEGTLECAMGAQPFPTCDHPGDLGPIAEALDLPVVAVVSCRGSDSEAFHLPRFPEGVDAILLDELADPEHLPRLRRLVHWTTGLPVVGAIEAMPGVRAALERVPRNRHLPDDLIDELARSFLKHADLTAIDELARCRPFRRPTAGLALSGRGRRRFRVAYAQDEAFGRYFPDTIEALEALGADLVEFSPLRDEGLPERVNLVMIGCGLPDHHADDLASNHSMIAALGEHVCLGRRIYSEGGGTAYLGRRMMIRGRYYRAQGSCRSTPSWSPTHRRRPRSRGGCSTTAGSVPAGRWSAATRAIDGASSPGSSRSNAPPASVPSPPRGIGSITIMPSAACCTFISVPCRRSSPPSRARTVPPSAGPRPGDWPNATRTASATTTRVGMRPKSERSVPFSRRYQCDPVGSICASMSRISLRSPSRYGWILSA